MLKRLINKLSLGSFGADKRGSVKIMVAVTTPIMLLMAGAGIDTAELYRTKINFQTAVDAAALTAAKTLAATGNVQKATDAGEEIFYGNIRNVAKDVADANVTFNMGNGDCTSNPIVANATLRKDVFFANIRAATFTDGKIIDGSKRATEDEKRVLLSSSAEVQCGNDTIEIAMVLDNSGSMRYNGKIATLRSASADLVNTLHTTMGQSGIPDPIKFSLVPFSTMVNVGANNRNSGWMDTQGVNEIHHENLNWALDPNAVQVGDTWRTASGDPLTRFTLYDQLPGINWKGCVQARPYPHHTQDTVPTNGTPNSMFVPSFAPDTPDNWTGDREQVLQTGAGHAICTSFQRQFYWRNGRWRNRSIRRCSRWDDGHRGQTHPDKPGYRPHWDDRIDYRRGEFIGNATQTGFVDGNQIFEESYQNNYLADDHNFTRPGEDPRQTKYVGTSTDINGDGQWGRQKWTWKYFNNPQPRDINNNRAGLPSVAGVEGGPNTWCQSQAITDLTTNQADVINAISTMDAEGATNVQAGMAWGWRTLSETEPFTNGRPYSAENNKKVMIVMTDGNNTAYPIDLFYTGYSKNNKSYYDTFGHSGVEGRIFEGFDDIANPNHDFNTFRQAMDSHLIKTCNNVKAAGIQVYTIAFDVPNGSSVKTMLENCASPEVGGGRLYFDANNNAELIATFQKIAEKLADLALVK